jgi:hypothetical protein
MKWFKPLLFVLSAVFIGIQFVRPPHTNPPVDESQTIYATNQVPADVHQILERSCADCHSSKTVWPWYGNVAPVSWLLAKDIREGRRELNISDWQTFKPKRKAHKLKEICEQVRDKKMPLPVYTVMHPSAKLSDEDRTRLCQWAEAFAATFPKQPSSDERR